MSRQTNVFVAICLLLLVCVNLHSQCLEEEAEVQIFISPDEYPQETFWNISSNNEILVSGDVEGGVFCVPSAGCKVFNLFDTVGDGICCGYGIGSYSLIIDGDTLATGGEFADLEQVFFHCPTGSTCSAAEEISQLSSYSTQFENHWYLFQPDTSGIFQISTCNWDDCGTEIWIYDYCEGLQWDDSQEAAIYFTNDGCSGSTNAYLEGSLLADNEYWIRIRAAEECSSTEVLWSLEYDGPAAGCMDTSACNFDPFAQLHDAASCIYPGNPECPNGPDLLLVEEVLRESLALGYRENDDQCFVEEGCLSGYGNRTVLRFTTRIENIGNQDFYIGQPPESQDGESDQWEWDPCHGHWHYEGYARYLLYDEAGNELPAGFKNGFCVMDLDCSWGGGTPKYGCGNQGITAQCGDIYDSTLDCQWIDVTDFPSGIYTLVVTVNWDQSPDSAGRYETDWSNNWMQACFFLSYDEEGLPVMSLLSDCDTFTDCEGIPQGDAQPDCNGDCDGPAVRGDVDGDLELTDLDRIELLNRSLDNTEAPSCLDLNADGFFTVCDAALLQYCLKNESDPLEDHCDFPYGVSNINDTVSIRIHSIDLENQDIYLGMKNPQSQVVALQFVLGGVNIIDVKSTEGNPMDVVFDEAGQISILMPESPLDKSADYELFLKVTYNGTQQAFAQLDLFVDAVNEMREAVQTSFARPEFVYLYETNTSIGGAKQLDLRVGPNPFHQQISFELKNGSPGYDLRIFDLSGQLIREIKGIDTDNYTLLRTDLPSGTYFYEVIAEKRYSGKILAE